jgi:hypothetical protein
MLHTDNAGTGARYEKRHACNASPQQAARMSPVPWPFTRPERKLPPLLPCYLTINREQSNFLMELLEHIQYPPSIPKYLFTLTF